METVGKYRSSGRHLALLCLLVLACALMVSGCRAAGPANLDAGAAATELDAALARFVAGQKDQRHAMALVDAPTVGFHYAGAEGLGRVDSGETITPEHQFFVASVGKSMTAVLVHQLAEEGAFGPQGIDTTLASLEVLPPEALDQLLLVDGISYGRQITLRHLLNHTSGLRDVFFDSSDSKIALMPGTPEGAAPDSLIGEAAFDPQLGLTPLAQCVLQGQPAGCNPDDYLFRYRWAHWDYPAWQADPGNGRAGLINYYLAGLNQHGLWAPGEGFHYGDTNYILLGLVIEHTTGNSLHHELRQRIFEPLGMQHTYLVGATQPPTTPYEGQLAEVWAWGDPANSAGVDFSFDWGGGGIISTLDDLHTYMRALVDGELFREEGTLAQMSETPQGIRGIYYGSGWIAFPSSNGPVLYMLGSNGSWVEYYPPLDMVMAGTIDDFSNMPGQFMLHIQLAQILAKYGLRTPMARFASPPMQIGMLAFTLALLAGLVWLIAVWSYRRRGLEVSAALKGARRRALLGTLLNLGLLVLVGYTFGQNIFQMLFGFTPQVRLVIGIAAVIAGLAGLVMAPSAVRLVRRKEGRRLERWLYASLTGLTLLYALSMGLLLR